MVYLFLRPKNQTEEMGAEDVVACGDDVKKSLADWKMIILAIPSSSAGSE